MKWESCELGQIADTTSGGTPTRTKSEYWGGDIPWVKSGELRDCRINSSEEFITEFGLKNSSAKLFAPGTLLLALYGATAGKLGILDFPATTNQAVCGITPKKGVLHTKYLYYYLLSKRKQIIKDSFGGAQPNISQGYVRNLRVPVPPLGVQQQIADTLDKADALRRKDQELLQKYDELAQSIFYEMFGNPAENEHGWATERIGNLTSVSSGSTPSRDNAEYYGGSIKWVKTTEVRGGRIVETEESLTPLGLNNSSCKVFPAKSVIVAMYGQGKTRGQVGILECEAATNQACAVIAPSSHLDSDFLFYQLKLSYNRLRELGRGGNQQNLNLGMVKDFTIILPDQSLQKQFSDVLRRVENTIGIAERSSRYSAHLFSSLLSSYFA